MQRDRRKGHVFSQGGKALASRYFGQKKKSKDASPNEKRDNDNLENYTGLIQRRERLSIKLSVGEDEGR